MMMKKDHKTDLQHTKFQILTATDKKPIENSMIKTTSTEGIMVGYTDARGFVNLGPFSNGERVRVFRIKKSDFDMNKAELKNGTYNYLMSSDKMEFVTVENDSSSHV